MEPLEKITRELLTANKEPAYMANTYFVSVFTMKHNANIPKIPYGLISDNMVELTRIPITSDNVLEECRGLKADKLPGSNGLDAWWV